MDAPGTGRFIAHGRARPPYAETTSVIAICDVSHRMRGLREFWLRRAATSGPVQRKRMAAPRVGGQAPRARAPGGDNEAAQIPEPVAFAVYLDVAPQAATADAASAVCIMASCVGGGMSIDGACFPTAGVRAAIDRCVDAVVQQRALYRGPLLHQGSLAQCACSTAFDTSLLHPPRQQREFSLRAACNARHSAVSRYGHSPVHSVRPELCDALVAWCVALGLDDAFARDMETCARHVANAEVRRWTTDVLTGVAPARSRSV